MNDVTVTTFDEDKIEKLIKDFDQYLQKYIKALKRSLERRMQLFYDAMTKIRELKSQNNYLDQMFENPILEINNLVKKYKSKEEKFICPIEKHDRPCGYREKKKVLCPKCGSEMEEMSAIGFIQWNCTNKECRFVEDDY